MVCSFIGKWLIRISKLNELWVIVQIVIITLQVVIGMGIE